MSSFDYLTSGDLVGAFVQTYTGGFLAPFAPYFYGLIIMALMGVIYIKTENLTMVGVLGFLMSSLTIAGGTIFTTGPGGAPLVPPAALGLGFVVLVMSLFIVIWKMVKR